MGEFEFQVIKALDRLAKAKGAPHISHICSFDKGMQRHRCTLYSSVPACDPSDAVVFYVRDVYKGVAAWANGVGAPLDELVERAVKSICKAMRGE